MVPVRLAVLLLGALAVLPCDAAEPPRIDHIERFRFGTNEVLLHFDTEPNRTYALQYVDGISPNARTNNSSTWGNWSNLFVAPRLPFPNHYVILDTGTNRQRYYRLSVTP